MLRELEAWEFVGLEKRGFGVWSKECGLERLVELVWSALDSVGV